MYTPVRVFIYIALKYTLAIKVIAMRATRWYQGLKIKSHHGNDRHEMMAL